MAAPVVLGITIRSDGSAQVNRDLQSVRRNLNDTGNAAQSSNRQFAAMARETLGLGSIMRGLAAGFSTAKIIQELSSFESKMINVKALTMANASEMAAMEKQARELGAVTAFSAQQAAEAQGVLASAGLQVNEILSTTPAVLQLAAAGNLDLARATEIAMGTIRGLGLGLSELGRVNDVFAKTAADTQANINDMGSALTPVAPIARISKIGIEELGASIGVLANNNIKGETAGNQLKSMLSKLADVAGPAEKTLANYGLKVEDVNVSSRGLSAVMHTLQKANLSASDTFSIFGTEAAAVGSILISSASGTDSFATSLRGATGAAKEQADILNQGLAKSWDAFLGTLSEASLQLGDSGLKGSLTDVITTATGVIAIYEGLGSKFAESNGLTKEQYENLKSVAGELEVVAGAAGGIATLTAGIWLANTAMLAFNLTTKASPFVLITTAAVAGIGAVIGKIDAAKKAHDEFMTSATTVEEANLKVRQKIAEINAIVPVTGAGHGATDSMIAKGKEELAILIQQRSALEEKAAAESTTTGTTKAAAEAANVHENGVKKVTEASKEHEKALKKTAQGVANEIAALNDQHQKLALSERAYEDQKLAAMGMTGAVKDNAMAIWDSNKALEAQKTSSDKAKSELESLADKYNQLTMSARDYYEQKLKSQGLTAEQVKPVMAQFDKNIAFEAQQKGIEAARDRMSDYDKIIQQVNESTSKLGATNEAVFDGALGGINTLVGVFQNMGEALKDTTHQQELLNKAYAKEKDDINNHSGLNERQKFTLMLGKEADYLKDNHKLERDKTNDALTGTRQMIGATAKMFDEKSSAAKALHSLETGIAVAQMAMQGVQMVKDLAATGVSMAAGAAKMFSQSGWGGFVGVAAMGAVMAGLGYSAFGGGGGSEPSPTYSPDTGTVLGDSTAKSESIDKTYQLLKDIHADEYAELRGINRGIASLSTGITDVITRLFQSGGIKDFATLPTGKMTGISGMLTSIDPINKAGFDPIGKAVLGFLFGGKQTSTVTAQGISTGATSIADIMAGGNLSANQFATIETKTKGGLLGKDKVRYSEQYAALDAATQDSLNKVFGSMGRTMLGLAESIGHDTKQKVEDYIIPAMRVDLKGLNGEDAAKKLNGVISAALDSMSTSVFGGIIGQYQKLGEGMLETAVRIVAEVAVVKDALGKSGLSIAGDAIAISDALVQAAGGLQEFQKAFDDYYQKFYTESERNVFLQKNLVSQLEDLNTALPATREGYRKLVESLDVNNAADAQRYSLLIKLSGAADDYYKVLESASESALQVAQQRRALDIQLMELSGNAIGALTEKRRDELAAMDESLRFSQQAVWALSAANKAVDDAMGILKKSVSDQKALNNTAYQAAIAANNLQKQAANDLLAELKKVADNIKTALGSTVIESDAFSKQRRLAAQSVLKSALGYANAGGSLAGYSGLDQALTDIAKPSEQLYSSFVDFARDQGRTGNMLAGLADHTQSQISVAEQTLAAIDASKQTLTDGFNAENARLDALVTNAQAQIDAINGTTAVVMSVNDAVINMTAAMDARMATANAISSAQYADKAEMAALNAYNAAAAKSDQSTKILNYVAGAAQDYSAQAQAARAASTAPMAPAPSTWQSGQSGNAMWEQVLSLFNAEHMKRYGITMNRPWNADADAQRQYGELVLMYNSMSASAAQAAAAQAAGLENLANATAALIPGYQQTASVDQSAAAQAAAAYAAAKAYTAAAQAAVPNIQGFATGGDHSGGWRVVGENGPELEYTPPSHIFSNSQSKSLVDNSDLIAELKALRSEVAMLRAETRATATHTNKTAKLLERAMPDGDALATRATA
jgi:TP901 family phage tail tape measure protein